MQSRVLSSFSITWLLERGNQNICRYFVDLCKVNILIFPTSEHVITFLTRTLYFGKIHCLIFVDIVDGDGLVSVDGNDDGVGGGW